MKSRMLGRMSALLVVAACGGSGSPSDLDEGAATRVQDGIRYTAETRIMESFPVQIAVTVTLTNTSAGVVRTVFPDGCVVTLRAYRGSEQVWDQRMLILCTDALVEVDLAPGESASYETATSAAAILGPNLPDGRYRLEAVLRPGGAPITLDAGEVDLAIPR